MFGAPSNPEPVLQAPANDMNDFFAAPSNPAPSNPAPVEENKPVEDLFGGFDLPSNPAPSNPIPSDPVEVQFDAPVADSKPADDILNFGASDMNNQFGQMNLDAQPAAPQNNNDPFADFMGQPGVASQDADKSGFDSYADPYAMGGDQQQPAEQKQEQPPAQNLDDPFGFNA
uniref:Uncharacterized protein n=1 Tax=Strombidium inclinatum TaxID=197538 RepID=A0A7S3MW95_9SPIT|mmetsp:Transcript_21881/g.33942  ORF Transcript_21881/g.33942 Transcript_21881/m.33942 type:complete len:172 (+) Transcript_21881:1847-2362(+)